MAIFDPTTPDEFWYPIPFLPGYELSSDLRVRSFHVLGRSKGGGYGGIGDTYRIIGLHRLKGGYLTFHTRTDGRQRTVYLHHVISAMIYGPTPEGHYVRHYDDDKDNNYPSNLGFGLPVHNSADARRNGKTAFGSRQGATRLTEAMVAGIKALLVGGGLSQKEIAARFGCHPGTVSDINVGKVWGHVPWPTLPVHP